MLSSLSALFLAVSISRHYCFNIDVNHPIVYGDPLKKSGYFGYSLVLKPGNSSDPAWILIGAPKENNANYDALLPGLCFKCEIGKTCQIFDVADEFIKLDSKKEIKMDGAWIGGTMDINYKNERGVVCAYRWTKIKRKNNVDDKYYPIGSCYSFQTSDNTTRQLVPFENGPFSSVDPISKASIYHYGQGQAGFSVHMPPNEKQLLLGAPGAYNWKGTSILYKDSDDSSPTATRKRYVDPANFGYKIVHDDFYKAEESRHNLLGYSSTSGYFSSKTSLQYVSGAPRSDDYRGQVLIYDFENAKRSSNIKLEGTQFGEYFGASVTAGDVDNDGFDELIVGAPFYTAKTYNEGKIYIFSSSMKASKPAVILGKSTNGQFGTVVQYLGDLHKDGFGDLAVAAPYEEANSGVVYIYRGTKEGLESTFCQRIVGKDVFPNIRGFGISISRPADIDFNTYSDIAVGAYLSGNVVLLRSRPPISIHHDMTFNSSHLNYQDKSFQVTFCFRIQLKNSDPSISIAIRRILTVDGQLRRANLKNEREVEGINLNATSPFCHISTVQLSNSISNFYDPITVSLSHELITKTDTKEVVYIDQNINGIDRFCSKCFVYNSYDSSAPITVSIPFALGCSSDNTCRASLEFTPKLLELEDSNTFVLGSKNYVTLQTGIKNVGEKAYLTEILVILPEIITFQSIPSTCHVKNSTSLYCAIDNPLKENEKKIVNLYLDMTKVNSGRYEEYLTITVMILTSSENDRENVKQLVVKLTREADVTITGKSGEQSYSFRNVTQKNLAFTQTYHVEKFGTSALNEILIEINIPDSFKSRNGDEFNLISLSRLSGKLDGERISCTSDFRYVLEENIPTISDAKYEKKEAEDFSSRISSNITSPPERPFEENKYGAFQNHIFYVNCGVPEVICSKITCEAGPFKSGQIVNIDLSLLFDVSAIEAFLESTDVILFATNGRVTVKSPPKFIQNGDQPDTVEVVALFIGESVEEKVALWIIILSVIAGLLLLLVVILGLIKGGFFKRTTKEELELLKKDVELEENKRETSNLNEQ